MDTSKHMVCIPMEEYNELLSQKKQQDVSVDIIRKHLRFIERELSIAKLINLETHEQFVQNKIPTGFFISKEVTSEGITHYAFKYSE